MTPTEPTGAQADYSGAVELFANSLRWAASMLEADNEPTAANNVREAAILLESLQRDLEAARALLRYPEFSLIAKYFEGAGPALGQEPWRAEIHSLRAQLASAERDAARLDWLDRDDVELLPGVDDNGAPYMAIVVYSNRGDVRRYCAPTIRAAIDAALSPPAEQEGR
jgi:hypothetical protein